VFLRNVDVLHSKIALINSTLVYALGKHQVRSADSKQQQQRLNKDDLLSLIQYSGDRALVEKVL
jgi:hypothetical protein